MNNSAFDPDDIVPEPWATPFRRAGFVNPNTGEPSLRALYRDAGIHGSTMRRLITGETRNPRTATIKMLASVLGEKPSTIARWVRDAMTIEPKEWTPPKEAQLLTKAQRKSLTQMIKAIAEANVISGAVGENGIEIRRNK